MAAGALGLVLAAIRAAQPGIHPDADMAGVALFVAGALLLAAGTILAGLSLDWAGGPGRLCGLVIIGALAAAVVAGLIPELGGVVSLAFAAVALGFGELGLWCLMASGVPREADY